MIFEIALKTYQHLQLTFLALFIAAVISIPFGILLSRIKSKKIADAALRVMTILQTIPGLAMMALIIVVLVMLKPVIALPTTGILPSIIILIVYSCLPICSSTYTGIVQVDHSMVEIADGMGMTKRQKLFFVEFPLALPVIISGIRMALVWTIGLGTLTSLIGSGGLGDYILQGLRAMQPKLVLAGTIPAAALAVILDWFVTRLGRWILPNPQ